LSRAPFFMIARREKIVTLRGIFEFSSVFSSQFSKNFQRS